MAGELAARGAHVGLVTTPSQAEHVAATYPYSVYSLPMHGFERRLAAANLRVVRELAAALPRAWRICGEFRPDVVVGGGGFVSGPVLAAAGARRIPALAIENDARLGVANRLARPFVRRYCLSFPIAGLEPPKYVLTGRPLPAAQVAAVRTDGLRAFGLQPDLPVVLAFGGSQGAQSINRACLDAFARETLEFQLVHVCGPRNFYEVEAERRRRGAPVDRYRLVAYTDQLPAAMAAADLIVARSGGSVAEIAALGRPAILVPYPHATGDHQRKNAEWMVHEGAALLVDDAELDGPLLQRLVGELLADEARRAAMAAAMAGLGRPHATARVVEEIERVLA